MTNRPFTVLTWLTIASFFPIAIRYATYRNPSYQHNTFIRTYTGLTPEKLTTLTLGSEADFFAGMSDGHIYLGNHLNASSFMKTPITLVSYEEIPINIASGENLAYRSISLAMDSSSVYMMDGTIPFVLKSSLTQSPTRFIKHLRDTTYFSQAIPIAHNALAMFSVRNGKGILLKKELDTHEIHWLTEALEKQVDGYFCVQGDLLHDRQSSRSVYIYRYRNQYICFDSNMDILYKARTIDPIDTARIKVARLESERSTQLAAPPLTVNRTAAVDAGKLYVISGLLAGNDEKRIFKKNDIVDVYDLHGGSYIGSFRIPHAKGQKAKKIAVAGNRLFALYGSTLVSYSMRMETAQKGTRVFTVSDR